MENMTPPASSGKERRKFKRVDVRLKASYLVKDEMATYEIPAVDISVGGARLLFNKITKQGTKVRLTIAVGDDEGTIVCGGRVAWQDLRPVKGENGKYYYDTGVEFEELRLKDRTRLFYYCLNRNRKKT